MPIASNKGGHDFAPIPAGSHLGICYACIDIGTPPPSGNYLPRRKVLLIFELPNVRGDFEVDGVKKNLPRAVSKEFTLSLSTKSNLRPSLVSWRGREFTEAEEKAFEVGNVVGAMALLSITHKKSKDGTKTYANITGIMQPMKGTAKMKPENPTVIFDIPKDGAEIVIPETIPEWIVNKIKMSEEFNAFINPKAAGHGPAPNNGQAFPTDSNLDEDVPF